jgi:YVTN family beta-propeller protein
MCPMPMVWNSINNKVYRASDPNTVTVIDGATNEVVITITVGVWPWGMTWNSIQNRTYVANVISSTVSVIRDNVGIEEEHVVFGNKVYGSTILSGPLFLPEGKTCKVYDITGRIVEPDRIQPGIYFIEVDGVGTQKVVKVR